MKSLMPAHWFAATLALIAVAPRVVAAQDARRDEQPPQIEISGVLGTIRFVDLAPFVALSNLEEPDHQYPLEHWLELGIGGRFTLNLSRTTALEAEVIGYPRFAGVPSDNGYRGWGKVAVLGGTGLTFRVLHLATTVAARAGVIRFGRMPAIVALTHDDLGRMLFVAEVDNFSAVFPAADVAAGIRGQLSRRVGLRLETGDFIIRYAPRPRDLNPTFVRHNWHLDFGLAIGFW